MEEIEKVTSSQEADTNEEIHESIEKPKKKKKKKVWLIVLLIVLLGIGSCTAVVVHKVNEVTSDEEIAELLNDDGETNIFTEEGKKKAILKIVNYAAKKYIGSVDNASYDIKENSDINGYELNIKVKGLHSALEADYDKLDEVTPNVVTACEKTSNVLGKLLSLANLSDSRFQVNILDDKDSTKLYSATNGETTVNKLTEE